MPDQLDTVARAIWAAHTGAPIEWGEIAVASAIQYRRMAQAAIDALGLPAITGQMTKVYAPLNEFGLPQWHEWYDDRHEGQKAAWAEGLPLGQAWVSPWVTVEPNDE